MLRIYVTTGPRPAKIRSGGRTTSAGKAKVSRRQARDWLLEANPDREYHAAIRASVVWDEQIEALLARYQQPGLAPLQFTYRQACQRVSWEYRLSRYGRFTVTRPSVWRMLRTYRAWRAYFVRAVSDDQAKDAFTGADEWLNRGEDVVRRHVQLRAASLAALSAHLQELMQGLSPYEQFQIRCSVAVVCRSRAAGAHTGTFTAAEVLGRTGTAPLRPIAR
ncbi:hypothetical protein Kisp01_70440 [Kineosporia sp. NBRC 101677]|uniref:hypothetical protein n=1 Tax=Kineosporia sp. NBRC 101677 TaxID=3032197 RepID=UPI00249F9BE7|nr:hypothetical protein [Kineosporia sp. NBRC 101677]GLY20030.1 hypothetical protein Kisp01_70440 [Kineosporia sp. NBRC 101677]